MTNRFSHITTVSRAAMSAAIFTLGMFAQNLYALPVDVGIDTDELSASWKIAGIVFFSLIGVAAIVVLVILFKSFSSHRRIREKLKSVALESIFTQEMLDFAVSQSKAYLWKYSDGEFVFINDNYKSLGLETPNHTLTKERFIIKQDYEHVIDVLNKEKPGIYEFQIHYVIAEEPHWFDFRMRVANDGINVTRKGVAAIIDDKKEREAKAAEAHQLLVSATERGNCLKLLGNEIHRPATIIKGYAEVLTTIGDELEEGERRSYYNDMTFCGYVLANAVDNMLQFDLIDKDDYEPEMEECTMGELIDGNIFSAHSYMLLKRKSITLKVDECDKNLKINVDPAEFNTVIANLLSNAAKFSPKESTVHLGWRKEWPNVVIYVQDEGIGIEEDLLENIFQRFYKINPSIPGVGIGLALSKHIVEAMNGKIGVNSQKDVGSRFWVSFPLVKDKE